MRKLIVLTIMFSTVMLYTALLAGGLQRLSSYAGGSYDNTACLSGGLECDGLSLTLAAPKAYNGSLKVVDYVNYVNEGDVWELQPAAGYRLLTPMATMQYHVFNEEYMGASLTVN